MKSLKLWQHEEYLGRELKSTRDEAWEENELILSNVVFIITFPIETVEKGLCFLRLVILLLFKTVFKYT